MVNEPPISLPRKPRQWEVTGAHTAFQAFWPLKRQGIGPVLLTIRREQTENTSLEPSLTSRTCTDCLCLLPAPHISGSVQAHRQSLTLPVPRPAPQASSEPTLPETLRRGQRVPEFCKGQAPPDPLQYLLSLTERAHKFRPAAPAHVPCLGVGKLAFPF